MSIYASYFCPFFPVIVINRSLAGIPAHEATSFKSAFVLEFTHQFLIGFFDPVSLLASLHIFVAFT